MMKLDRGSVSAYFLIVLLSFFILSSLLLEYTTLKKYMSYSKAQLILDVDAEMSFYDRDLFEKFGLLGVYKRDNYISKDFLNETNVIVSEISRLMKKRLLLVGVAKTEEVVQDFIRDFTGVNFPVFDINDVNDRLRYFFNLEKPTTQDIKKAVEFVVELESTKLYAELHGMSWNQLFDLLKKGDLKKIREFRPYLVIKDEVNSAYDKMHEFIEKIDVLNIHTHYYLSDYSISYLGYSNTKNKDDKLRAEYVLTGSENSKVSKAIVDAEIYAMRLCFNFIECFSNELVRSKIRKFSFGSIKLFVLEAIALSLYEAKKDLDKIRDGGRVPFIKSSQGFMSANGVKSYEKGYYYHDYLKLLMMLLPKDVIAKRIIRAVENQSEMKLKDLAATIEIEREVEFEGRVIPWKVKKKIRGELSFIK